MYLPYTEIGQQLADQLEKKDFSSQHRAKNSSFEINQQLADQLEKDIFSIPWGHHMLLIDKFLTCLKRLFSMSVKQWQMVGVEMSFIIS